jgi:hypothetical protein
MNPGRRWFTAFKIRPGVFLQLAKLLTSTQIQATLDAALPNSPLYPVTFPASEAAASMKVTLAHLAVAKERLFPILPNLDMRLGQLVLVYFPFALRSDCLWLARAVQASISRSGSRTETDRLYGAYRWI